MEDVWIISPIPTKGDTIPPKRKPTAPKIAAADPGYCRPSSIANAVEEEKTSPSPATISNIASLYKSHYSVDYQ